MIVSIRDLQNGMRVIVDEVPHFNSVAVSFWITVGSRFENNATKGMSHFLEHMMFKGTKTRSALDIALAFDDIGGDFNARTGRENIVCYAKVLKKHLPFAMEMIADIVLNSSFPEDEIERERGVIIQEMLEVDDNPSDIVFDKFFETAYSGQQFGCPILGSLETINSFTKNDFIEYMNNSCTTQRCILSVAGNVSADEVVQQAEKFFSGLKPGVLTKPEPANYTGGSYVEHRSIGQLNLILGFPAFSCHDERIYPLKVLDGILGTGMSSRLFQEVREKRGLAYSIYSSHCCYSDCGTLFVSASTEPKHVQELIRVVGNEVIKLSSSITDSEVNRVIERICTEIEMSREGVSSMADASGSSLAAYGRYITKQEMVDKIRAVTLPAVIDLWESIVSRSADMTIAAVGDSSTMPDTQQIISHFVK